MTGTRDPFKMLVVVVVAVVVGVLGLFCCLFKTSLML